MADARLRLTPPQRCLHNVFIPVLFDLLLFFLHEILVFTQITCRAGFFLFLWILAVMRERFSKNPHERTVKHDSDAHLFIHAIRDLTRLR